MAMDGVPMVNGTTGAHGGEDYQHWMESKAGQAKAVSPQVHRHGAEVYSNTLPARKVAPAKSKTTIGECPPRTRVMPVWVSPLISHHSTCTVYLYCMMSYLHLWQTDFRTELWDYLHLLMVWETSTAMATVVVNYFLDPSNLQYCNNSSKARCSKHKLKHCRGVLLLDY